MLVLLEDLEVAVVNRSRSQPGKLYSSEAATYSNMRHCTPCVLDKSKQLPSTSATNLPESFAKWVDNKDPLFVNRSRSHSARKPLHLKNKVG
jgi:hypothetical protein